MGLPTIGPLELIIILAIALLIVGPGRLPEMGNAIGRTIREFRKASSDVTDATKLDAQPQPQAQPAAQPVAPLTAAEAAPSVQPAPQPAPLAPNTLSNQVEPNVVAPPTPAPVDRPATPGDTTGGG